MLIGIAVVAWALVGTGPATAGSASWAVQANAVCKTQKAKTRVVRARLQKTVQPLIRHQPLTHAQWSYVLHTSLQLLRVRLRELERVPSPVPPLGQRALRLTRLNVAELARATQAFEKVTAFSSCTGSASGPVTRAPTRSGEHSAHPNASSGQRRTSIGCAGVHPGSRRSRSRRKLLPKLLPISANLM
jgi:hypothetical protein